MFNSPYSEQTPAARFGPYTLNQHLGRALGIYRAHFVDIIGVTAIVMVPASAAQVYALLQVNTANAAFNQAVLASNTLQSLNGQATGSQAAASAALQQLTTLAAPLTATLIGYIGITVLISVITAIVLYGAMTHMASEHIFERRISLFTAFRESLPRFGALITGTLIANLLLLALVIGLAFLLFLCGFGIPVIVFTGVALTSFLVPVLVLERVSPFAGLSRAFFLGRKQFWFALRALILLQFLGTLIQLLLTAFAGESDGLSTINISLITIANVLITPLSPILFALIYFDVRNRLEGVDTALSEASPNGATRIADLPSPRPTTLFNRDDFQTLSLLMIGLIALAGFYFCTFSLIR